MSKLGCIQRYMLIIRLVRSRPYISLEDLVREVECAMAYYDDEGTAGVSRRTVLRDIGDIRSGLGVSVEYSRSEGGYYIPEDEDRISDLERVLEQFDLITSLRAREELSSIVFAEKRKAAGTEHLSPLIYAVKKHLEVEFIYVKYDGSEPRQRRAMPYALKEGQGRWYLLAIEIGLGEKVTSEGEIKSWGLDRIRNLRITDNRFVPRPDVDVEADFKDSFGVYSNRNVPVEEVVLSMSPREGRYCKAYPLHESQEVLIDNNKEVCIRLRLRITFAFRRELLSRSDDITVIAPAHLREELKTVYRDALHRMDF